MTFSKRSALAAGLNPIARARRAAGADLIDLSRANPTLVGLDWPEAALRAALAVDARRYQPRPFGWSKARAAVAASMPVPVDPEQVVLTASTSEAYGFLFKALCDPGDRVLAFTPSYPLFEHLARLEGVILDQCPLAYDGAWHLDLAAAAAAIRPETRAILLVHPNNPTGHHLQPAEIDALAAFGLPLIVDEVFAGYDWGRPPRLPSICARPAVPAIALGGLSKSRGLPQLKAGWMVLNGPAAFRAGLAERLECICDAWLSISTPVQLALPALLADATGAAERIHQRVLSNLAVLDAALRETPIARLHATGGWYAMLRPPRLRDATAWTLGLIEAGVAVQPGWFYDSPVDGLLVISLLPEQARFAAGVARLCDHIAQVCATH